MSSLLDKLTGGGNPNQPSLLGFLGKLPDMLSPGLQAPIPVGQEGQLDPAMQANLQQQYQQQYRAAQAQAIKQGYGMPGATAIAGADAQTGYGQTVQNALAQMATIRQQQQDARRQQALASMISDPNSGFSPQQQAALSVSNPDEAAKEISNRAFPKKAEGQPVPVSGGYVFRDDAGNWTFAATKQDEKIQVLTDGTVVKVTDDGKVSRDVPTQDLGSARVASIHAAATTSSRAPSLSPDALQLMVARLRNGEKLSDIAGNLGRGAQGAANIAAIQNAFAQSALSGPNPMSAEQIAGAIQDLKSQGRALIAIGAREGNIAPRAQEAHDFANMALEASRGFSRDDWTDANQAIQFQDRHFSDPKLAAFNAANVSLINAYAAAVGGGVLHKHDQEIAQTLLQTTDGAGAYEAAANQLLRETDAALAAPEKVKARMKAARAAPPSAAGSSSPGWGQVQKH